ncbi:MAG TPA: rhamnulose-1-phosphate aldolase [Bacteroidota bacterium]|nr:rhamnulose-1-phosphate aldolase [Bacteroidota bacterium]
MAKDSAALPQSLEPVLDDVVEIAGYLWDRGWTERSAGNLSVDVTDIIKGGRDPRSVVTVFPGIAFPEVCQRAFLVPAAGSRMRDVARHPDKHLGLIRIAPDCSGYRLLWGDDKRFVPSAELPTYLRIHQTFLVRHQDSRAVLHAHPEALIAMTQMAEFKDEYRLNSVLWGMNPETTKVVPNGVGLVHYLRSGTGELAQATVRALENHSVVLWEKHGCFAVGKTLGDAFDVIDTLEKSARIFFRVKSTGRTPEGLTNDQLQELRLAFLGGNDKRS